MPDPVQPTPQPLNELAEAELGSSPNPKLDAEVSLLRATAAAVRSDRILRIGVASAVFVLFLSTNVLVALQVRELWNFDKARESARDTFLYKDPEQAAKLPAIDRFLPKEVLISLVGATAVQVGASAYFIVQGLFGGKKPGDG